jgi:hypothetical protein
MNSPFYSHSQEYQTIAMEAKNRSVACEDEI